jgi:hypothetical protein
MNAPCKAKLFISARYEYRSPARCLVRERPVKAYLSSPKDTRTATQDRTRRDDEIFSSSDLRDNGGIDGADVEGVSEGTDCESVSRTDLSRREGSRLEQWGGGRGEEGKERQPYCCKVNTRGSARNVITHSARDEVCLHNRSTEEAEDGECRVESYRFKGERNESVSPARVGLSPSYLQRLTDVSIVRCLSISLPSPT